MVKWSVKGPEGEKLVSLLAQGTIDSKNLERKYILQIKSNYPEVFGKFADDRFIANYKKVVREFAVHKSLQGKRTVPQEKDVEEEEDEEEEAGDEEEETEEDETENLTDMATPKKKDNSVHHLEEKMSTVTIAGPKKLDMHKVMYTYANDEGVDCVVIHIEAPSSTVQDSFVAKISNNQRVLEIEFKIASMLLKTHWLSYQNDLRVSPNVLNAYNQEVMRVRDMKATTGVCSIKLPFAVESSPSFLPRVECFKEGNPTHTVTKIITFEFRALHRNAPSLTYASRMNVIDISDMDEAGQHAFHQTTQVFYHRHSSGSASASARSTTTPPAASATRGGNQRPTKRMAEDQNFMIE